MSKRLFFASAALGGAVLVLLLKFAAGSAGALPPCPFWSLTGLYCPGCGSTRAMQALLHGHPFLAAAWNPALLLVFPAAMVPAIKNSKVSSKVGWAILAFVLVFAVARNLPWYPFTLLAPGGLLR